MRKDEVYFCTRARLASALTAAGFHGKSVPNVFDPHYHAWEFRRTTGLDDFVKQYFRENGR